MAVCWDLHAALLDLRGRGLPVLSYALGRHVDVKCALARAAQYLGVHGAGK